MKEKVLGAYADGSEIRYIARCFDITEEEVIEILHNYREESKFKRSFTDEFKKLVAERDLKFSRRQIAQELGINVATVKKSCEQFGNAVKDKAVSDNLYTLVKGVDNLDVCPTCKSHKVNDIESMADNLNTKGVYCMNCGDEHFTLNETEEYKDDNDEIQVRVIGTLVYKVNFEYLEE